MPVDGGGPGLAIKRRGLAEGPADAFGDVFGGVAAPAQREDRWPGPGQGETEGAASQRRFPGLGETRDAAGAQRLRHDIPDRTREKVPVGGVEPGGEGRGVGPLRDRGLERHVFAEHAAGVLRAGLQVRAHHHRPEFRWDGKLHDLQRPPGQDEHDPSIEGGRDVVGGWRSGTRELAGQRALEQLCAGKASPDCAVRRHRARHRAGGAAAHASGERNAFVKLDGDSGCGNRGVRGHGLGRCAGSCQPQHRAGGRPGTVAGRVHRNASLIARDALDDDPRLPRCARHHDIGRPRLTAMPKTSNPHAMLPMVAGAETRTAAAPPGGCVPVMVAFT